MDEDTKRLMIVAVAVVLIFCPIAACTASEWQETAKIITACIEKAEDPRTCEVFEIRQTFEMKFDNQE